MDVLGFFLLSLATFVVVRSECHCSNRRSCHIFPDYPCRPRTGSPIICEEGWFGPYCQKENVALRRQTTQSSTFFERGGIYSSLLAVDGRTDTTFYNKPRTCSHTFNESNPTWSVILDKTPTDKIQQLKIYLRDEDDEYIRARTNGMAILVNDRICFDWSSDEHPPIVADVNCRQPLDGNTVTISVPHSFLTLCEVQIFICSDGWFGEECDKQCNCEKESEICDKITGECKGGCLKGTNGTGCQPQCEDDRKGTNCRKQCGKCLDNDMCDFTNGKCPRGCQPGWTNDTCKQPCPDDYYGNNCTSICGRCLFSDKCDIVTGSCSGGCLAGWRNDTCLESCEDGTYGDGCNSSCGHCKNSSACDKPTGRCSDGCDGNQLLPYCQECKDGYYGDNCSFACGRCLAPVICDKTTGFCPGLICEDGMYGPRCNLSCGHCQNSSGCNTTTGHCLEGCQGDYKPPFCKGKVASVADTNIIPIVVIVVPSVGLLIAVITGALCLCVRRKAEHTAMAVRYETIRRDHGDAEEKRYDRLETNTSGDGYLTATPHQSNERESGGYSVVMGIAVSDGYLTANPDQSNQRQTNTVHEYIELV